MGVAPDGALPAPLGLLLLGLATDGSPGAPPILTDRAFAPPPVPEVSRAGPIVGGCVARSTIRRGTGARGAVRLAGAGLGTVLAVARDTGARRPIAGPVLAGVTRRGCGP